jgi:hypothetical protein
MGANPSTGGPSLWGPASQEVVSPSLTRVSPARCDRDRSGRRSGTGTRSSPLQLATLVLQIIPGIAANRSGASSTESAR